MINLKKIKQEKCQLPPFKKTCPCTILPTPFFNFQDPPPSGGGNQNLLPSPLKRGEGGPNYVNSSNSVKISGSPSYNLTSQAGKRRDKPESSVKFILFYLFSSVIVNFASWSCIFLSNWQGIARSVTGMPSFKETAQIHLIVSLSAVTNC